MKEFIEKIMKRIAKKREYYYLNDDVYDKIAVDALDFACDVIEEESKEYNNGWIPCSERLPDEATTYEVTKEIVINSKKQYIVDHCLFGTEGEWICSPKETVIAWMPLPEPYCNKDN